MKTVEVNSIANEIAWETYLSTGAVKIDSKTAMYYEIDKILNSDIFKNNLILKK